MNKEVEVTWAQLNEPLFIPNGVGNYKATLSASATGPDTNMKMYLQSNGGLLVVTKGYQVYVSPSKVGHAVLKEKA